MCVNFFFGIKHFGKYVTFIQLSSLRFLILLLNLVAIVNINDIRIILGFVICDNLAFFVIVFGAKKVV